MYAFLAFLRGLNEWPRALSEQLRLGWKLWRLPAVARPRVGRQAGRLTGRQHSLERDRQAITFHYNISNDFFALWLDPRMVYSCAYFTSPEDSLAQAQEQKLDYLCRKLRLQAGETLLDIGCGWGGLLIFAAQNYNVKATGVTLSAPQAQLAQERIRQLGLDGRCRVECADHRLLDQSQKYDKIASIGFTEHLGESMLPTYCRKAHTLLRPAGVLLVQTIALTGHARVTRWRKFSQRYVFPDGELVPVSIHLREAERAGFEVRDVESLREHYALTLKAWLGNLEGDYKKAVRLTDEATCRTFRMYLAGARCGFTTGVYNLYQLLVVKPDRGASGLPLTRAEWYR
jgi:cyclopropane-fatty-acyl-phospholipid synthase